MTPKIKGLLVRVGVDSGEAGGYWNAPADSSTRAFCYVPINRDENFRRGMATFYKDKRLGFERALRNFGLRLPAHLRRSKAHLDPDYRYLTYGDVAKRAGQIRKLSPGDFLVFYSSFRDICTPNDLIYAITGVLVIADVKPAKDVPSSKLHCNAHTRVKFSPDGTDIVVFGKPKASGRLQKFIPIGSLRKSFTRRGKRRSYYVSRTLLQTWGEPPLKDWYIQRSRTLLGFSKPQKFLRWLRRQKPRLTNRNN